MSQEFTIRVDPVGAPRMTQRDKWAKRPCVVRYMAFRNQIKLTVGSQIKGVPKEVRLIFFFAMPENWSQKKRAAALEAGHTFTPDIDNLIKGVLDALFPDDSAVQTVKATKVWGSHGAVTIFIP